MAGMDIAPIVRAQDFTIIKHNDDMKAVNDQVNFAQQADKNTTAVLQEVVETTESKFQNMNRDAKDKGSNEYYSDGGKKRQKSKLPEDRVIIKGTTGGFDLKI